MRSFDIEEKLKKLLRKLSKKDKETYNSIIKKINEILTIDNINHYKNLKKPMQEFKRVQIGSFVLIFKHIEKEDKIVFYDFDHHDNIYK